LKDKAILLLDTGENRPVEKVVYRALVSTGSNVSVCNCAADAEKVLAQQPIDLLFLNYDHADDAAKALVRKLMDQPGSPPAVLLSEKKDKAHLIQLFSHERLRNLIARNDQVAEEEVIITVEKILRQDIFGIDKYLTWGVSFVEEPVKDSAEKKNQIDRVAEFVRNLRCDERYIRMAEIVADELLMNALYDAPVDENGRSLYAHLPRSERVTLQDNQAKLMYGSDGRFFVIACRDHFGALRAPTVVHYLKKCFSQDEYQVDSKSGGAGVGFYMIFQSISQLVINIQPGKMTETMGLIDIRAMYRQIKARSKSFNIFVKETT
jgi:hypothetical protein